MAESCRSYELNIRVGKKLRDDFTALCKEKGIPINLALRRFVKHFTETGGNVPFAFDLMCWGGAADEAGCNDKISFIVGSEDREAFKKMCQGKCSSLIRGYMEYCVRQGGFPEWVSNSGDIKKAQYMIVFTRKDGSNEIFSGTYYKKGKKYVYFAGTLNKVNEENKPKIYHSEKMASNALVAWASCANVVGMECRVVKVED